MTYKTVKDSYTTIIEEESKKAKSLSNSIFQVGTLRLIIVIACIVLSYLFWQQTAIVIGIILLSIILFASLMLFHNKLFKRRLYAETKIKNAQDELNGINYDYNSFDGGKENINGNHSFSLDLDLFGERSFFQSINRTVTSFGKNRLSQLLLEPFTEKKKIYQQQEAVKELSGKFKLLMHYRTIGKMTETDALNLEKFTSAFNQKPYFRDNRFWSIMTYIVPLLYALWIGLFLADIIPSNSFMLLWVLMIIFSSIPSKKVQSILAIFDKRTAVLDTYTQLFRIIEDETVESPLLKEIKQELEGEMKASETIAKLKSYHNNLDMSFTFPILLIFNPILLWNIRYSIKIEKWIEQHKNDILRWFDAIAKFDAITSQAIYTYNHPDYIYPEVSDTAIFEAQNMGHPLLKRKQCVRNDVHIQKKPYFLVVTGANMAGKSTYLRTIGINHMLACCGMPVCADSLLFYPNKLVTNLRTSDSLADNESYFFAELKRLKMIIDRLKSDEELFVILDEILKGTNSEDKQKGSLALIRQLVELKGVGIIATHDLLLGNLEKEYPESVKNYRFEADIKDDHLSFSYKIREGVAQNMNACFLMKQMGITGL